MVQARKIVVTLCCLESNDKKIVHVQYRHSSTLDIFHLWWIESMHGKPTDMDLEG
jgi:hypothetical protein